MKRITLLGSTGSIGLNALEIIRQNPEKYRIIALSAGRNIDLLLKQIEEFRPKAVSVLEEGLADVLRTQLKGDATVEVYSGAEGFKRLATLEEVDTVISAMTGAASGVQRLSLCGPV